jgi:hydrogenase expression/formation protein HypC
MCLGVPGLVVERLEPAGELEFALVEFAGLRRRVCVSCTPDVSLGDYVIVHAGVAINRLDTEEAERVLEHLRAMGDVDNWDMQLTDAEEENREVSR